MKNLQVEYIESRASNVTLYMSDFDSTLVDWAKNQTGVKDAAGKVTQTVKLKLGDGKEDVLNLISIPDFTQMNLNLLITQKGSWPPQKGELFLERGSMLAGKVAVGDNLQVNTAGERIYNLVLAGTTYDNSAFPYVFTNQMTGYISWDTLGYLGFPKRYNTLEIATSEDIITLDDAEKFTYDLTENLRRRGVEVKGSMALKPNQHWAADNSKAFTSILSVIGVFSLILSGFLVINTISALLTQQKKQIGIMKAIGADAKQITSLYLIMVGFYGFFALVIALPVGILLGYVFLKMVTGFLNLDIRTFYLPPNVLFMQLGAALIVPVVAAIFPIIAESKTSIRSVISDYPIVKKTGLLEVLLVRIRGLSRPVSISLRNAFRKKGRLALTLGTLLTAGALFMSVINVRTSMFREMDRILQMFDFQVSLTLNDDYPVENLIDRIGKTPDITEVEARTRLSARRIKTDGTKGTPFSITGLPPDTPFSHPVLLSGRWLRTGDSNKIVLSSGYIRDNPDLAPGSDLYLSIGNDKKHMEIVGVIAMSGGEKEGFSDFNTIAQFKDKPNLASSYLVKTVPDDPFTQNIVAREVEEGLKRAGITVGYKQTKSQIIASAANQFNFLIVFLLAMAVMVAIVGGLGLAGTMSLNVLERTREIGIMRSIGAGDGTIRKLVLVEGILIGLISWLIAIPISIPLTYGFCYAVGNPFFGRTLVFAVVPSGMLIWFLIVMFIAVVASLLPARRASKMSISDTLSYE